MQLNFAELHRDVVFGKEGEEKGAAACATTGAYQTSGSYLEQCRPP